MLSDSQIERYSRQIIVPELGARAQERLLASRLLLAGELRAVETVLAYMVGAGVGTIHLATHGASGSSRIDQLIAGMAERNPDATVVAAQRWQKYAAHELDLALTILNTPAQCEAVSTQTPQAYPSILARLIAPAKIAVISKIPPCPACADAELWARTELLVPEAGFVAMVAATEALKILIGRLPGTPLLLEFDGYRFTTRELMAISPCSCSAQSDGHRE